MKRRPWYLAGMAAAGDLAWSAPYREAVTGDAVVTAVVPLRNALGKPVAVFAADTSINQLNALLAGLHLPENSAIVLFDSAGNRLAAAALGAARHWGDIEVAAAPETALGQVEALSLEGHPWLRFVSTPLSNGWYFHFLLDNDEDAISVRAIRSVIVSTVLASLLVALLATAFYILIKSREARDRHEKESFELAFLRSQIKPHFLFNTLNTLISLSHEDVGLMRRLLVHLSGYLHHSFDFWSDDLVVPLYAEIELVQNWLAIEQARFEHCVDVRFDIHADRRRRVPVAILQPIIENALHHGILAQREAGCIRISINEGARHLNFSVSDDGIGFDPDQPRHTGRRGIGLDNIARRLRCMYDVRLDITSAPGEGTRVAWSLPLAATSPDSCRTD